MNKRIRKKQQKNINILEDTKKKTLKQKLSNINKKWLLVVVNVIVLVGVIVFVKESYAYLYQTLRGEKSYSLRVKGFSLKLDDSSTSENIKIENSIPVSDEAGKQSNAYTFSIINEDTADTGYVLYLDDVEIDNEINRMKDTVVKYQLIENGKETVGLVSDLGTSPFRILTNGVISGNQTNNYSLRFWINETAEVASGQIFNVKIRVIATSKEAIVEGKLVFGETVVTSDSGVTSMTSDELQTYVDRALGNKIETALNQKEKEILDKNHPVGSIYISETNQNPSEIFGGTWERYATGKTLVGVDETNTNLNAAKKTGGNTNGEITLTVEQLPAHNHAYTPSGSVTSTFKGSAVTSGNNNKNPTAAFTGSQSTTTSTSKDLTGSVFISGNMVYNVDTAAIRNVSGIISISSIQSYRLISSSLSQVGPAAKNDGITIDANHTHTVTAAGTVSLSGTHTHSVTAAGTVASTFTGTKSTTENTGSGATVSTQDPYITVYMWKRIS